MNLKVSSLTLWPIFKAIVKIPNKVPCNFSVDKENETFYLCGSEVSYLFQTGLESCSCDDFNVQLPYSAIERLAKLKKKDAGKYFDFSYAVEEQKVTIRVLDENEFVMMSFFVEVDSAFEKWQDYYQGDFLNDLQHLTPEHISSIAGLVKNQSDLDYCLILPEGFLAVGDYQVSLVTLGLQADEFVATPFLLSSTLLTALLQVDPNLAVSSNIGDYLKSESYCITLPPPKASVEPDSLLDSHKVNYLQSIFSEEHMEIALDDCAGIADHIQKAATVDDTFDLCELSFAALSTKVEVRFYKDLAVSSETSFELIKESPMDLDICFRVKNLVSALKTAKTDAVLTFVDESVPTCLSINDLTKIYLMPSILIKDEL